MNNKLAAVILLIVILMQIIILNQNSSLENRLTNIENLYNQVFMENRMTSSNIESMLQKLEDIKSNTDNAFNKSARFIDYDEKNKSADIEVSFSLKSAEIESEVNLLVTDSQNGTAAFPAEKIAPGKYSAILPLKINAAYTVSYNQTDSNSNSNSGELLELMPDYLLLQHSKAAFSFSISQSSTSGSLSNVDLYPLIENSFNENDKFKIKEVYFEIFKNDKSINKIDLSKYLAVDQNNKSESINSAEISVELEPGDYQVKTIIKDLFGIEYVTDNSFMVGSHSGASSSAGAGSSASINSPFGMYLR